MSELELAALDEAFADTRARLDNRGRFNRNRALLHSLEATERRERNAKRKARDEARRACGLVKTKYGWE